MAAASRWAGGGARRWGFPPTPVLPTYITAVAAGPYHVVRDEHDGIPLGVFCRQSLAPYLDAGRDPRGRPRQGFDFFHGSFGMQYPFGKYDQLFVPEFKEGAMENAGCVTFLEAYIFRSRVTDFAREAARSRPSCTRWRTCGSATWSRCAGGTICGSTSRSPPGRARSRRPRRPAGRRPGPRSPSCTRPGRTGRTSCPPPTRSRRTSPTSTPSR